jgi:hypothetical protein
MPKQIVDGGPQGNADFSAFPVLARTSRMAITD